MLLIIYKNNIIEKIMSVSELNDTIISNLKKNKIITKEHNYIAKENTNAVVGLNINAINDDGSVMSLAEQVEKGYYKVPTGFIFKNGKIEKMTDIERIEASLDTLPKNQKIVTDESGNKHIEEKTEDEKIAEGIITTDELKEIEKQQAITRLQQIDIESIRPLRAVADNTATDEDHAILSSLNEEATDLRRLLSEQ